MILGALFHDIGHLVGLDKGLDRMVTGGVDLGAKDHETVGEEFLKELGFPSPITDFVKGHVQAKRYLVSKNKEYYNSEYAGIRVYTGNVMSKIIQKALVRQKKRCFDIFCFIPVR